MRRRLKWSGLIFAATTLGAIQAFAEPCQPKDRPLAAGYRIGTYSVPSIDMNPASSVVVLEPETDEPVSGRPLLVLLHGLGGTGCDWVRLGQVDATLAAMPDTGARPIVVMPSLGNNWYVDAGPGRDAEAAFDAIIEWVDAKWRIDERPRANSILGLSMGGYGALRLAMARPRFGSIAALSPAIWQNVPQEDLNLPAEKLNLIRDAVYFDVEPDGMFETGIDLPNPGPHFSGAFGDPFDGRRFNALNVFTLLNDKTRPETMPRLLLAIGDHDSLGLWRGTFALYQTLKARNVAVHLRVAEGDHNWKFWRSALPDALAFLAVGDPPLR